MKNDQGAKKSSTTNTGAKNSAQNSDGQEKKNSTPPLLEKFFMDMMKDIYWAEKRLVEVLPEMQKAATTDELQEAFEDHLLATQKHVSRLEKVFRLLGKEPESKK